MLGSLKSAVAVGALLVCAVACGSGGTPAGAEGVSSPQTLASLPTLTPRPSPTPMAVLPGEPWIAYSWDRHDGYGWKLYLVRPDGSDSHQIMDTLPGEQRAPAWSPDGTKLAFVNIDPADPNNPNSSIWIANADGSDPQRFFDQGDECGNAFHPSWSPDGTKLALICYFGTDGSSVAVLDIGSMVLTHARQGGLAGVHGRPAALVPGWQDDRLRHHQVGPDEHVRGRITRRDRPGNGRQVQAAHLVRHASWRIPTGGRTAASWS